MTDPLAAVLRAHWHHHPLADDKWRCDCGARYSTHPAEHAAEQVRAWLEGHREVAARALLEHQEFALDWLGNPAPWDEADPGWHVMYRDWIDVVLEHLAPKEGR